MSALGRGLSSSTINYRIWREEAKKLISALKIAKDSLEQSELVADLRQRDLHNSKIEIDRVKMITEDIIVTKMRDTKLLEKSIDEYRKQLEDGATRAAAADSALVEERGRRKALRSRLNSAENVAAKEIARIKKQSELQEIELEKIKREKECAVNESHLFKGAIDRLLLNMNEDRTSATLEEEREKKLKREKKNQE